MGKMARRVFQIGRTMGKMIKNVFFEGLFFKVAPARHQRHEAVQER